MVYLLHFDAPYKHAKHYIGYTESDRMLEFRLEHHRKGTGARLMKVIGEAGIGFKLARTWDNGDRNFERYLKNLKATPRICPICNPNAMNRANGENNGPRHDDNAGEDNRTIEQSGCGNQETS